MKPNIFFICSFILNILVTIMAVFFLNKFLFFIYGYDINISRGNSAEAFEAYRNIYKSKVSVILASIIISFILLFFARKLSIQNPYLVYKIIYGICGLIAIVFIILYTIMIILPNGPMV
jgi:hypothetical protein